MCVWERESVCGCVRVSEWERERERKRESILMTLFQAVNGDNQTAERYFWKTSFAQNEME